MPPDIALQRTWRLMVYPLNARSDDKRLRRNRSFVLRRISAPLRGLPAFLIIGAMKGGTSSLFNYLIQHPMVRPPLRKEIHYFSLGYRKGKSVDWYRAHFPRSTHLRGGAVTGEATPDYMFSPGAVGRIFELLPHARLIVLLRDPVERAISHYFHELRMGREYLPIEQAMEIEEERLAASLTAGEPALETYLHASYKKRGCYVEQLAEIFRVFPRDQVLVLGSGTLFATPQNAVAAAASFLGLEGSATDYTFPVKNRGENRESVSERLRGKLEYHFAPHNERLFKLLGAKPRW